MSTQPFTFSLNFPDLTLIGGAAWFLWMRYQALEKRLTAGDKERKDLDHAQKMARLAEQSNVDRLELFCNGNKELIEHRSERFQAALTAIEKRLMDELSEIKEFLSKTTQFGVRNRVE